MRILGIDPGYAILGYGVIDTAGVRNTAVDFGVIETRADEPFPERLERLYAGMRQLIGLYRPDAAAFEELFFYRNTTTAISVGAGRAWRCWPHSRAVCRCMSIRPCRSSLP